MNNKTIPVTSPLLPPLEEFIPYLEKIWESRFLTNGGDMHHALEEALCEYLGVKHIVCSSPTPPWRSSPRCRHCG